MRFLGPQSYLVSFLMRLFHIWERLGFHVTRNNFYSPIPDTMTLTDDVWSRSSELVGLDLQEGRQLELLQQFSSNFKSEYDSFPKTQANPHEYYVGIPSFGPVDAAILYCMIRYFQPRRIIEVGCGSSTLLSAMALLKNERETGQRSELISIDPYPNEILKKGIPGLSRLVVSRVELVPLSEFTSLEKNDILFIDSSHVLRIGGDVQYEYLEVFPRLKKGVLVHAHDIFLPREYPKRWVMDWKNFWNEQYLLQAFLYFNSAFEILWAGSYMHLRHPEALKEAFGNYTHNRTWPVSLWMRRKA